MSRNVTAHVSQRRKIETGRELTVNRIQRALVVLRVQIPNGFPHHQSQFHLIVQVRAAGSKHRTFAGTQDGGGRLQEEEGLFGLGVVQLGDVVTADETGRLATSQLKGGDGSPYA